MVDTPKSKAPSDQQINQAYQQALSELEPSELLDKRIQNMAKQQAKQNSKTRSYFWAAAPWWASAASLACVGVLGWWLVTEMSVPPSEMSYQSNVQLMSPPIQRNEVATEELEQQKQELAEKLLRKREEDIQAIERERRQLAKQKAMQKRAMQQEAMQAQAKQQTLQKPSVQQEIVQSKADLAVKPAQSADQHYASEEQQLTSFSALASDAASDAGAIDVSDLVLLCVEQSLGNYSAEQLEPQLTQDLQQDAKQALSQPARWLTWQKKQWKLVTVESAWLLVGDGLDANSSLIYRLPSQLVEACEQP
ncbi:PRKR-interacting protein 1 [Agarivorans sp. Alg241-V36]|uniref:PRKR-interacting protein 1 n=1 Tax=Agarivorans sp. Alg241-V36 TaxID=2305992 RepID=UPI0013CFF1D6|nr:PRKR-interacting protein 1 [Agarivorans sp. Alg241-V36]